MTRSRKQGALLLFEGFVLQLNWVIKLAQNLVFKTLSSDWKIHSENLIYDLNPSGPKPSVKDLDLFNSFFSTSYLTTFNPVHFQWSEF